MLPKEPEEINKRTLITDRDHSKRLPILVPRVFPPAPLSREIPGNEGVDFQLSSGR